MSDMLEEIKIRDTNDFTRELHPLSNVPEKTVTPWLIVQI